MTQKPFFVDLAAAELYTLVEMALLSVSNLSKRMHGKWVLWDINLEIDYAEIMGFYGRSDSGKSVFAGILAGLDDPSSGTIDFIAENGQNPIKPGIALEKPSAAGEFTLYEHLDMFAALWGISKKKRAREVTFLLELLKLSDYRSVNVKHLSKGIMKRVEIARAMLADSPLILIDGLLDNLDSDIFEKLWDYFLALRRTERKTILIFTSSGRVAEMCGRISVLSRGKICFTGKPDDFRRLAGEDMVVLGDLNSPFIRDRIQERLSVVIKEEEGFLSFRVANGEKTVSDLLAEFGSDVGCVYLKRPKLEDALDMISAGRSAILARDKEA